VSYRLRRVRKSSKTRVSFCTTSPQLWYLPRQPPVHSTPTPSTQTLINSLLPTASQHGQPPPIMYFPASLLLAIIPAITASILGNAIIVNSSPDTIYAWSVGGSISDRQTILPGLLPPLVVLTHLYSTLLVLPNLIYVPRRLLRRAPPHRPPLRRHRAQTHNHTRRPLRRLPAANLQLQRRRCEVVVWFE
jgi:hypothetical protein